MHQGRLGKCSSPELTSPLNIDLKFYLELLKDFGLIMCMGGAICAWVQVPSLGRGVGSPCRWSYRRLSCLKWILGTELGSSAGTASISNHSIHLCSPWTFFKNVYICFASMYVCVPDMPAALSDQITAFSPLGLEWQTVVSRHVDDGNPTLIFWKGSPFFLSNKLSLQ